ncbi:MAG: hypothetical protein Q8L48_32860 [Archangium sp.]|nr:hypothetical protein [Archangium sp.]
MTTSAELLEAVASQRDAVARLEGELVPRRAVEKKELAELEARLAATRAGVKAAQARLSLASERMPGREAELLQLEAGLSRARAAWVRVFEPALLSAAILLVLFGWGLTEGRVWPWQLAAGLTGIFVARVVRARRA